MSLPNRPPSPPYRRRRSPSPAAMPAGSSSSRTYLPPPDSLADLARPARGYNRDRDDWRRRGDDMYVPGEGRENQGGSGWMPRREEFDRREREREREREQERRRDEDRVRERDRRRDDDRFRGRDYRDRRSPSPRRWGRRRSPSPTRSRSPPPRRARGRSRSRSFSPPRRRSRSPPRRRRSPSPVRSRSPPKKAEERARSPPRPVAAPVGPSRDREQSARVISGARDNGWIRRPPSDAALSRPRSPPRSHKSDAEEGEVGAPAPAPAPQVQQTLRRPSPKIETASPSFRTSELAPPSATPATPSGPGTPPPRLVQLRRAPLSAAASSHPSPLSQSQVQQSSPLATPSLSPTTPLGPRSRLPVTAEPPKEPRSARAQRGKSEVEELLGMQLPGWLTGPRVVRRGVVPFVEREKAAPVWSGFPNVDLYNEYQKIISTADDLSLAHSTLLHEVRAASFALADDNLELKAATLRREIAEHMADRAGRGMTLAEGYDTLEGLGVN